MSNSMISMQSRQTGFSSKGLAQIDQVMHKMIDQRCYPGAVILIARHNHIAHLGSYGFKNVDAQEPMQPDTLFRIHSMTKPITCAGAMTLFEEGKFQLDDPVSRIIPEFKDVKVLIPPLVKAEREITILNLLTHTAGLSYGAYDDKVDALYRQVFRKLDVPGGPSSVGHVPLEQFIQELAALPLAFHPGQSWRYSLSIDVLGYIIEKISGVSLDRFLHKRILDPLEMRHTCFSVPTQKLDRLGPQYVTAPDGAWKVNDPPAGESRWSKAPRLLGGGDGLISTATDYFRFSQMMLNGGSLNGIRILKPETVALMTRNHIAPSCLPISFQRSDVLAGCGFGLGFAVVMDVAQFGRAGSSGTITWGGAASTGFWVDPKEELICIFMAQVMPNQYPHLDLMSPIYAALKV